MPFVWVVDAANPTIAAASAERQHRIIREDTDTIVRYVDPGAPDAGYQDAYTDLRGISSRTLVPTPQTIRLIAEIQLALRRLDRHLSRVNADPDYAAEAQTSDLTLGRTAVVATHVRLLKGELGFGI